jgi:hypothetical protein
MKIPFLSNLEKKTDAATASDEGVFDILANRILSVRILMIACLFFMFTTALGPITTIYIMREPQTVVQVNGDGSVTISPQIRFRDAIAFHKVSANLDALTMLNRGPDGLDSMDIIDLCFNSDAKEKLKQLLDGQKALFTEFSYHQKAEISATDVIVDTDNTLRARVQGQLIRTGVFNGRPKLDSLKFEIIFSLFRNQDAATNQKYPIGVWDFDYRESR